MKKRVILLALCTLLCVSTAFASNIPDGHVSFDGVKIGASTENKLQTVYYTIPYIKGPVQLSPSVFTLHIGERIHVAPAPNSIDPGRVRFMTSGSEPLKIVDTQSAGRQDSRTNTELIITGKKVGTAQFKIVPDYGDWPRAATITIHVIP